MPTAAAPTIVLDPTECLDGLADVTRRLQDYFHVRIQHVPLAAADLAFWLPGSRTLRIREDAHLEDQVWVLAQVWFYLAIGPWACDSALLEPRMKLVAPQGT